MDLLDRTRIKQSANIQKVEILETSVRDSSLDLRVAYSVELD